MGIRGLEPIIRTAINNNPVTVNNNLVHGIYRCHLSELMARGSDPSTALSAPTVCFDTSEFVHRSTNKNPDAHVSGIFNLIVKVIQHVRPIFVFDGKPPKEKSRTLEERRRAKAKAHEKLKTLTDMVSQAAELKDAVESIKQSLNANDDMDGTARDLVFSMSTVTEDESDETVFKVWTSSCGGSPSRQSPEDDLMSSISSTSSLQDIFSDEVLAGGGQLHISSDELLNKIQDHINRLYITSEKTKKKTHRLTDKQIQEIKTLLESFGIPYIHVDVEADAICAMLVKLGVADYGASNDMDLLAFGCPAIIRNINFMDDYVDVYEINKIIPALEITHSQFIDLCIILGCDYADRLIGLKNSMALPLIKKYGNIENIILNLDLINQSELVNVDTDKSQFIVHRACEARPVRNLDFRYGSGVYDKSAPHGTRTLGLTLFPWLDIQDEYRVFVHNRRVTAISQQDLGTPHPVMAQTDEPAEYARQVTEKILAECSKSVIPWLESTGRDSITLDFAFLGPNMEPYIVEFNPFGPEHAAGSSLFHWELNWDKLSAPNGKPVYFRFTTI